jgi:hypothetical protein
VKIEDIIKQQRQAQALNYLPPLQKKVLDFFKRRRGEVFTYDDTEMLRELSDEKSTAIVWSIWALEKKNVLAKKKVGRKTYFGLPDDIQKLNSALK